LEISNERITDIRTVDRLKDGMRALSIAGAFAYLIGEGSKTIELRNWGEKSYRGLVLLHCSGSRAYDYSFEEWEVSKEECPYNSIVGVATLVDCIKYDTAKKWQDGIEGHLWDIPYQEALQEYKGKIPYGHVFEDPYIFSPTVPNVKGTFRYWTPKDENQIDAFRECQTYIGRLTDLEEDED
jgi:hypothetical protein